MINYYATARRTYRSTKKTIFYLLQLSLLSGYNLYRLYGPPRKKLKMRNFQQVIADHLFYFDEREWPDSGDRIPHAPSLPVGKHYDTFPPVDPACPPPPLPRYAWSSVCQVSSVINASSFISPLGISSYVPFHTMSVRQICRSCIVLHPAGSKGGRTSKRLQLALVRSFAIDI